MRAMVKINSRLVETLRRIDRALQGPSLAALLFVLLLNPFVCYLIAPPRPS